MASSSSSNVPTHNTKKRPLTSHSDASRCSKHARAGGGTSGAGGGSLVPPATVDEWRDALMNSTYEDYIPAVKFNRKDQSVQALMTMIKVKGIDTDPAYQRDAVWKEKNQFPFINSVWKGFDINPIKCISKSNVQKTKDGFDSNKVVVECSDGKNRLLALQAYVNDRFSAKVESASEAALYPILKRSHGKLFSEIDEGAQEYFLQSVMVPMVIFEEMSDVQKGDYFQQTNKGCPISNSEQINAFNSHGVVRVMDTSYDKSHVKEYKTFLHTKHRARNAYYTVQANILSICMGTEDTKYVGRDGAVTKWCKDSHTESIIQDEPEVVKRFNNIITRLAAIFKMMDTDVHEWWTVNSDSQLLSRIFSIDAAWILRFNNQIRTLQLKMFAVEVREHTMRFKSEGQSKNKGNINLGHSGDVSKRYSAEYAANIYGQTCPQYNNQNKTARIGFIKNWYRTKKTEEDTVVSS